MDYLNARETSNDSLIIIDEGERRLIAALRRIFNNTRSLTRLFGRMASNISQDVDSTIVETIPVVARSDLVASPLVNQYARRNAELVKNLTVSEIDRFTKIIRTGEGRSAAALKNEFQRAFSVTESKAKLWARDQTLKLHSNITKERHQAVGIQRYFWTDSNDERVRAIHDELGDRSDEGETFSYRNPPVTSEDGRRNNPGEDYNCRCTAYPVL